MGDNFNKTFQNLGKHYDSLFEKYGNKVRSSQQSSNITRTKRIEILTKDISFKKNDRILDFGCGTGFLFYFLKNNKNFSGYYFGCDISKKIIDFNNKKFKESNVSFFCQNIINTKLVDNYDYIFINGTFNNNTKNNIKWMKKILLILFSKTKYKLIFNNLSRYVDYEDKNLFYADPLIVFDFCKKKLSNNVSINHGYFTKKNTIPYEFTTTVSKFSE